MILTNLPKKALTIKMEFLEMYVTFCNFNKCKFVGWYLSTVYLGRFDRGSELICSLIKEYDVFSSPFKLVIWTLFILGTVLKHLFFIKYNIDLPLCVWATEV